MGVAAYNRGTKAIIEGLSSNLPSDIEAIRFYNSIKKNDDAGTPFTDLILCYDPRGFWSLECPKTGYGHWYKSIKETMKHWNISIVDYDAENNHFLCCPSEKRKEFLPWHEQ